MIFQVNKNALTEKLITWTNILNDYILRILCYDTGLQRCEIIVASVKQQAKIGEKKIFDWCYLIVENMTKI